MLQATFISDEVSRDLDEAIAFARSEGIPAIELRMIGDTNVVELPWPEIERIRAKLEHADLKVAALSTPLFKCPLDGVRDDESDPFKAASLDYADHLAAVPRAADVAEALGTTKLRCFAFLGSGTYADDRDRIVPLLRRAGDALSAHAPWARFCVENEHSTIVRTAAEVGDLVRALGAPFEVLWDPGNAYFSGERGPLVGFAAIGGAVAHIHVKDPVSDGAGGWRFVPVGQGEIDYAAQVRAWEASGYSGYVSLEPHLIIGQSSLPGARACLDYLRPLLAAGADAGAAS